MSRVTIAPNLCPGVEIRQGKDVAWVTVEPTDNTDRYGKPVWKWAIIGDVGEEAEGEDLAGWGNAREMLHALLDFLDAAAEAYRYEMSGHKSENIGLFPPHIVAWAYQVSDELQMAALELEEERLKEEGKEVEA